MNQTILMGPVLGHDVPGQPLAGLWSFFEHSGYDMCWDRASGSTPKGPDRTSSYMYPVQMLVWTQMPHCSRWWGGNLRWFEQVTPMQKDALEALGGRQTGRRGVSDEAAKEYSQEMKGE